MLRYFERQVQSVFPVVDPAEARAYLEHFGNVGIPPRELYASVLLPQLNQGDLIAPVPVRVTQDDGQAAQWVGPVMVLSNSCDIDADPMLLVAPCQPFASYAQTGEAGYIRQNTYYSLLFLPGAPEIGDSVVDLSSVHSISGDLIRTRLQDGAIRRICSLTRFGWYFLIAKLTVHLLRPRSPDEARGVARPATWVQRIIEAAAFRLLSISAARRG